MAKDRYTEERDRQEEAKKRNAERKKENDDIYDDGSNDSVVSEGIVAYDESGNVVDFDSLDMASSG